MSEKSLAGISQICYQTFQNCINNFKKVFAVSIIKTHARVTQGLFNGCPDQKSIYWIVKLMMSSAPSVKMSRNRFLETQYPIVPHHQLLPGDSDTLQNSALKIKPTIQKMTHILKPEMLSHTIISCCSVSIVFNTNSSPCVNIM